MFYQSSFSCVKIDELLFEFKMVENVLIIIINILILSLYEYLINE